MSNTCAACTKSIRSTQNLQCSRCANSFHAVCLNISDIRKISADARSNYVCPLCKSSAPKADNTNTPVRAAASTDSQATNSGESGLKVCIPPEPCFSPSVTPDLDQLAIIAAEIKLMREDMREMKSDMKHLSENVASRLDEFNTKYLDFEKRDAAREIELCTLKSTVAELQLQLSVRSQTSLKNEIEISGITETRNENPLHIIRVTAQKIGFKIDDSDLDYALRVGPRRSESGEDSSSSPRQPRPLVVRFVRRHTREDFLRTAKTRKSLTNEDIGIDGQIRKLYFNERLTKENRQLFRVARQRSSEIGFRFCWTKNGLIYVRRQEGHPAIAIKSMEDLDRVLSPSRDQNSQPPVA